MEKQYLKIGKKNYRVEVNWNSISDFCKRKGSNELSQLDSLVKITVDDIIPLIHSCIKEGERMDDRDFHLSELDLGVNLKPHHVSEFLKIYVQQSQTKIDQDDTEEAKKK